MNGIIFNADQEKNIQDGINWFRHSSEQTFELEGEAGTGKSLTLYEIIRRLGLKPDEYMPMAYTGQASIVMRLKGFTFAKSLHSSLYEFKEIADENDMNSQFNVPSKKKVFRLKSPKSISPKVKLFVIDEGFLVPAQMRRDIESFGRKVIVAGDAGQLPPVAGDPAYFGGYGVHRLTQLMRQAEGNPIIYLAHRARRGLPIHCGRYGNNALVIEDKDLCNELLSIPQAMICGTNATRDFLNKYIRGSIRGIHSDLPVYGDRLICRDNNWSIERDNISLANGLAGTVVNAPNVSGFDGKTFTIDFVPDLWNCLFDGLQVDYNYFMAPYTERQNLKFDKYSVGEKFEYAYALTAYLCQGAEYHTANYVEEFLRPNIQNQLNYTGITRAKQNLIFTRKSKQFYSLFY